MDLWVAYQAAWRIICSLHSKLQHCCSVLGPLKGEECYLLAVPDTSNTRHSVSTTFLTFPQ